MATPLASQDVPNAPARDEPEPLVSNQPEPACQEAQKWIEAVTGKSFGDKDFRSALENGILLCELLSAIRPGLVKKINRLPTPIAGLDNLSVFLRGCEELGLKGSQLFDPGDLQDMSIRANLKDSDCNRKLKNVLNTVFWLGKAASCSASYKGPTLDLKEFEGLLAQMKMETDEGGLTPQKRSVRDSGYDCWDSERSESLSPPQHTRDNSLDSLDSFGSRSQHSPSPDVVNRGNSDGRGSDSEVDAHNKKPDVRKDDMLARRTACSESRSSIPFNQFLPNRTNASSYIPNPRRKPHTDEGEQRRSLEQSKRTALHPKSTKTVTWAPENNGEKLQQEEEKVPQEVLEQKRLKKLEKAGIKVLPAAVRYSSPYTMEEKEVKSQTPNIILRCDNDFLSSQKSGWDSSSDGEDGEDVRKVPDVRRDDLASRRGQRGPIAHNVHQFVPPPVCNKKDQERWEGIRRASQQTLQEKEISKKEAIPDIITRRDNPFLNFAPHHKEDEDEEGEGKVQPMPNKQKDDLAQRRAQSRPIPHRDGPISFISASMSQADMQKWERLKMTEPRSVSMSDILNEEEVGHLPSLSQSRYERMQEQYNSFLEEEDHWQDDLARWKNRRRSASQELIKKEEERKRLEKRMKQEDAEGNKRKSIKTYKEIVEDKERREAELCEAYRNAATPEEAAIVLQRYALRFTISDAILDTLKLPRPTSKPKADVNQLDDLPINESPINDSEISEPDLHKPEPTGLIVQRQDKMETDTHAQLETSVSVSDSTLTSYSPLSTLTSSEIKPLQSLELNEPQPKQTDSPTPHQTQPVTEDAQSQAKNTPPHSAQVQPLTTQDVHTLPSPPALCPRPVPLLAAKPYCQPRSTQHKPVKMDGLVRVNRDAMENVSVTPVSCQHSPQEIIDSSSKQAEKDITKETGINAISEQMEKDVPPEETVIDRETKDKPPPPQTEKSTVSSGSAITSLIGGRNCIITTTIVTELTATHVEPHHPEIQSDGKVNNTTVLLRKPAEENKAQPAETPNSKSMQEYSSTVTEGLEESNVTIETPILNLAKRVNHWVWDPNEERRRLERWQQEQERLLQEQYEREQEKLKNEWEKAQLEVEEEERKHNEEERRILEETVTPLSPTGLLIQQMGRGGLKSSTPENNKTETIKVPLQQNGQRTSMGNEDQHASKLHFFQDSSHDSEHSKKQELWKTSSLDRNTQLNQAQAVKRSGSHDVVSGKQSSSSSTHPPSPSRCVSGKRLCSGCSQPLGKGAAMIIDTLGLFFHIHCFKCGVCDRQLGDATAGTDVRIRNGVLSCHECYIASRGRGQPTTL
ncbi:LIM and calponin homology domains-containing protein 1-like isoform X10 [Channa argus]|uniref:LIM and calponin homology domains-containing protein 1-like isoform X10 n=1 Tax=Channa argus TaxID=215402 RepID=UPI0035222107